MSTLGPAAITLAANKYRLAHPSQETHPRMSDPRDNDTLHPGIQVPLFDALPKWGADLAAAFAAAQAEMPDITKGRTANVGQYRYTYADLSDVLGALRPVLARHGLFLTQNVVTRNNTVDVWTTIGHRSGQTFDFGPMSFPTGNTPQTAGSAVTYARRYSLLAAVGLATEDDDGQHAAQAPKTPRKATQAAPTDPEPPSDKPTDTRMRRMQALLTERGYKDRTAAIDYVSTAIGRRVESRNELDKAETERVIAALEAEQVPA
jgi:hypothetical protein